MENKEKNKQQETTQQPKPSDNVQLEIETVTPETHQSVPQTPVSSAVVEGTMDKANQNEDAFHHQEKEASKLQEEDKRENTEQFNGEIEEANVTPEASEQKDQVVSNEDNSGPGKIKDDEEGEDERDKIETIAP